MDPNTGYVWCQHSDPNGMFILLHAHSERIVFGCLTYRDIGKACLNAVQKSEYPYCLYHIKFYNPPEEFLAKAPLPLLLFL